VTEQWPDQLEQLEQLDLTPLHRHRPLADPFGQHFDYAAAFATLDLDALAADIDAVLTSSQIWWPADFGNYGPLIVRMVWHCAGTYRIGDGRGGASSSLQRFAPVDGWPDNRNLDKARRLLWPVKKKYGRAISWADLMVFAGNRALETMGLVTFGFAGGRAEVFEPGDVYWGPEQDWLGDQRHSGVRQLDDPLAADQLGLIYVNPEGPNTVPDPVTSARDIRATFARMGMDDEETVALITGGHTFGKTHTITSGLEGIWTPTPTTWDNSFLEALFGFEWDVALSPDGLWQWIPRDGAGAGTVPDPHDPATSHPPTFLTTDLALRFDPGYEPIARRFLADPQARADAFARAWFKLTHLDLGPVEGYLGPLVPSERLLWQDPVPAVEHELVSIEDVCELKRSLLASGLPEDRLIAAAWASASTFRRSDRRGGADGGRLRLEPQRSWPVNDPDSLAVVLHTLKEIQQAFSARRQISIADLIVLGGCAAVEAAARRAGHDVVVPFTPGRTDASQEWTDVVSFAALEPAADGFRNYRGPQARRPSELLLVDRADLLTLTAAELTVLVGGLRGLGANTGGSRLGVLTSRPGTLTTDFFVNLLDPGTEWTSVPGKGQDEETFEGLDRATGELRWTASRADLAFGANAQLRALAEVHAADDAGPGFVADFVAAWDKVMNLGRGQRRDTGAER
jgi:catalase-peroxidase